MAIKKVIFIIFLIPLYFQANEELIKYIKQNDLKSVRSLSVKKRSKVSQADKDCVLKATDEELKFREWQLSWKSPYRFGVALTGAGTFLLGLGKLIYESVEIETNDSGNGTSNSFNLLQDLGGMGSGIYLLILSFNNNLAKSEYDRALAIHGIIQELYNKDTLEESNV